MEGSVTPRLESGQLGLDRAKAAITGTVVLELRKVRLDP